MSTASIRMNPTGPRKITPCPADYTELSEDLVCRIHGQLERCKRCKKIKHPLHGTCECRVHIVTTQPKPKPKTKRPTGIARQRGPKAKPLQKCLFCDALSTRRYCEDHRKLYLTVKYWRSKKGLTEEEAVAFIMTGDETKPCNNCGRPIAYKQVSNICRKCLIKSKPPRGHCISCGAPRYSTRGMFCRHPVCQRLSIRVSYYRRCGKTDEQILEILQPAIDEVKALVKAGKMNVSDNVNIDSAAQKEGK